MDVELDYTIVKRFRGPSGTINLRKQEPELRASPSSALMSIRASSQRPHPGSSFTANDFRPDNVSKCLPSGSISSRRLKGARLSRAQHSAEARTVPEDKQEVKHSVRNMSSLEIYIPNQADVVPRESCGAVCLLSSPMQPDGTFISVLF